MNKKKQQQFEEEIARHVSQNVVTIINNVATCGKMPIYLAQAGYKVIVTGSKKSLDTYERFIEASKEFDKSSLAFSDELPYFSNNYKIIFITYGAELIQKILDNKDENTVLIVEDSYNCINANLLFSFSKELISKGAKIKLVIINPILKYSNNLSMFFDNAPVIASPSKSYYVTFQQMADTDIRSLIINLLRCSSHKNFLILLHNKDAIQELSDELNEDFVKYNIDTKILKLYSELPFDVQRERLTKLYRSRVILSTNILQRRSIPFDIDVVIDNGLETTLDIVDSVQTFQISNLSKAEISQRQALAGMYSPGVYYLCSDFNYDSRKEVKVKIDSSFDNMLLAMINANIDVKSFKLLHNKSQYFLGSSLRLLNMLGAIDENRKITDIGNEMSKIPMEVRFARILVEAKTYGVEFDALICCLVLSFGKFNKFSSEIAHDLKSDLFGQMATFKKLYLKQKLSDSSQIYWSKFNKTSKLFEKILHMLKITPSVDTDIPSIKKCLACGFPDFLFVCQKNIGYKNNINASLRYLFNDSALYDKGNRYIVGIPVDSTNNTDNTYFKRVKFPTAYTLDEVMECYSKWFKTVFSISGNNIFENQTYNGMVITSRFIGTVAEIMESDPDAFMEIKEVDKSSGKEFMSLYFHDLKVNSRPIIKIV